MFLWFLRSHKTNDICTLHAGLPLFDSLIKVLQWTETCRFVAIKAHRSVGGRSVYLCVLAVNCYCNILITNINFMSLIAQPRKMFAEKVTLLRLATAFRPSKVGIFSSVPSAVKRCFLLALGFPLCREIQLASSVKKTWKSSDSVIRTALAQILLYVFLNSYLKCIWLSFETFCAATKGFLDLLNYIDTLTQLNPYIQNITTFQFLPYSHYRHSQLHVTLRLAKNTAVREIPTSQT